MTFINILNEPYMLRTLTTFFLRHTTRSWSVKRYYLTKIATAWFRNTISFARGGV